MSPSATLRYPDPEDWIFNRVVSDISVVLRKTTLTISVSSETGSPVETEIEGWFPWYDGRNPDITI